MIAASIVKWIRANVPELATATFLKDPNFVVSQNPLPVCVVAEVTRTTEPWVIGDADRRHNARLQVTIYHSSYTAMRWLTDKFILAIEKAMTTGDGGTQVPGIDLCGVWDLLYNPSADLKTYVSLQTGWVATPTPVIYKNGDLTANIISTGFSTDLTNGQIVFGSAQSLTDKFYATYKAGTVDFVIADIAHPTITDIAQKVLRYNAAISLNTWFFVKSTTRKLY
jgi:hypothetical protein